MKVGTLTTIDGIELSLETSQLRELIEYLWSQQATEFLSGERVDPADAPGFGPEDYERMIQAAWAVRQSNSSGAKVVTSSSR